MKTLELKELEINIEALKTERGGYYMESGNYSSKHTEQIPVLKDGILVSLQADGIYTPLTLIKSRADDQGNLEVVFQEEGGYFWKWDENNAYDGWSTQEEEFSDEECDWLGSWIKS
jgi:hypothetical protein